MNELEKFFSSIFDSEVTKIIISKPKSKEEEYKKIVVEKKGNGYQISKYTEKQVFHENVTTSEVMNRSIDLTANHYRQVNGWSSKGEHIILISKNGSCSYKLKRTDNKPNKVTISNEHNRRKNYILQEGIAIEPLIDMGVFTKEGKVVNSMYDKYKQINRFIEILDDEISKLSVKKLNIIDFGCGKSYLTFVVYYYLTEIKNMEANIIGLDLKEDVIKNCNLAAQKYNYKGLRFELGDINGYKAPFDVDIVLTLHACDVATDYALYNAIQWDAKMLFSVPCCQHELNKQIDAGNLSILTRYGIIKERFSALATDAIRGNLLEYCGYKTQLLEFIDFSHTPKNILIRAIKRQSTPKKVSEKALAEIKALINEFNFKPTLYQLLDIERDATHSRDLNRELVATDDIK